ncbi:MAG: hypothetical protein MUP47_10755 [Phycisphaerae bacterium]|nr:hypothetical protein [Phycisphaerae bacterium]
MIYALEPLPIEPPGIEPAGLELTGAHCRLYHGLGSSESIDYQIPVALAPPGDASVALPLGLWPGQDHFLAARAVSAAGVEEQNTHIVCCAEVDEAGDLRPAPLGAVSDLTAGAEPQGGIVVGFSYRPPLGYAAGDEFQVLSDRGTGCLDLQTPIATVPARSSWATVPGQSQDYETVVPADVLPAMFAVRACANGRQGPLGQPVTVTAMAPPGPVILW